MNGTTILRLLVIRITPVESTDREDDNRSSGQASSGLLESLQIYDQVWGEEKEAHGLLQSYN